MRAWQIRIRNARRTGAPRLRSAERSPQAAAAAGAQPSFRQCRVTRPTAVQYTRWSLLRRCRRDTANLDQLESGDTPL